MRVITFRIKSKSNKKSVGDHLSPVEIKAIGSPELLYGSITIPGGYLELMEETGVMVDVRKAQNITIDKYNGVINSQYMKNE